MFAETTVGTVLSMKSIYTLDYILLHPSSFERSERARSFMPICGLIIIKSLIVIIDSSTTSTLNY
jgi:hypothetical protein